MSPSHAACRPAAPTASVACRALWLAPLLPALLLAGDVPGWASPSLHVPPLAMPLLALLLGGVLSGLLAGLLGIGGALVTLPVLHFALPGLGIDAALVPATAVATALMAMVPMTLLAAWRQKRHGAIETGWLRRMAGPIAVGAAAGALLAAALNGPVLAVLFAVQSIWYGGRLLAHRAGAAAVPADGTGLGHRLGRLPPWLAAPPMAAFCACVGMGGGSIITPFLLRQRIPFRHAVATAGALNLCIALGGSLAFVLAGSGVGGPGASLPAAVLLAGGAMVSVSFGVALAHRVPEALLRRLIGSVNVVSAALLLCQVASH